MLLRGLDRVAHYRLVGFPPSLDLANAQILRLSATRFAVRFPGSLYEKWVPTTEAVATTSTTDTCET